MMKFYLYCSNYYAEKPLQYLLIEYMTLGVVTKFSKKDCPPFNSVPQSVVFVREVVAEIKLYQN
ncbi:hypothetical protein VHARVF571_490023 [Vibrio harveyi]|nr:hypothetical protein VHARVF571_490023 [Vibrio harveyi]